MISTEQLSDVFVEVADTLVADFDVVEFLHILTVRAATVSGAEAVGLMLADQHDQLRFMAASNETGKVFELFQLQMDEGPCLDCFFTKKPVVDADLAAADDTWPKFAPAAVMAGYQSVHAFPMRWHDRVIGALNLFGQTSDNFSEDEVRVVQALADVATIALLQQRTIARSDALTEQLQSALTAGSSSSRPRERSPRWRGRPQLRHSSSSAPRHAPRGDAWSTSPPRSSTRSARSAGPRSKGPAVARPFDQHPFIITRPTPATSARPVRPLGARALRRWIQWSQRRNLLRWRRRVLTINPGPSRGGSATGSTVSPD